MFARTRRVVLPLLAPLLLLVALMTACADEPRIWFENQRDDPVTVSIDGDRLIILWPHTGQFLPFSTAAWAWPRRVDAATKDGAPLWTEHLDADDLTAHRWRIYIRP